MTTNRSSARYRPRPRFVPYRDGLAPEPLCSLTVPSTGNAVAISDVRYIGSYNWLKGTSTPTIVVPGSPPEWRNRDLPFTLPLDSSTDFVDQNPHRITMNSLQPMMTAIDIHFQNRSELFDWTSVDFITARNGLRKLLRWITCATGDRSELKPFRIDLQLVGSRTVILKRWEWEGAIGQHPIGYGVNFKQAMTVPGPDCRKSTSHERVVSYNFNGLKLVVRYQVDACLPIPSDVHNLTKTLAGVDLKLTKSKSTESNFYGVTVIRGGQEIPQSDIVEIATVAQSRPHRWIETYPQLFLSQTPLHFLGIHDRGNFHTIEKRNLISSPELQEIGKEIGPELGKLRVLLEEIQKAVIAQGGDKNLTLVCDKGGNLKVYERRQKECFLPDGMMKRFLTGPEHSSS